MNNQSCVVPRFVKYDRLRGTSLCFAQWPVSNVTPEVEFVETPLCEAPSWFLHMTDVPTFIFASLGSETSFIVGWWGLQNTPAVGAEILGLLRWWGYSGQRLLQSQQIERLYQLLVLLGRYLVYLIHSFLFTIRDINTLIFILLCKIKCLTRYYYFVCSMSFIKLLYL